MTYDEAVALYKRNKSEARYQWDLEWDKRVATYYALPASEKDNTKSDVVKAFLGWRALECENCGAGPGACCGGY